MSISKYVHTYTINIMCLLIWMSMATEGSWCRFFTVVTSLLCECERSNGSRDINKIENICERLERCVCNVQQLHRLAVQTVKVMEDLVEGVLFNLLKQISTAYYLSGVKSVKNFRLYPAKPYALVDHFSKGILRSVVDHLISSLKNKFYSYKNYSSRGETFLVCLE